MSEGTNKERIEQNNTKLNEIKGKISNLPQNTFTVDLFEAKYYDSVEILPIENINIESTAIIISKFEHENINVEENPEFQFTRLFLPETFYFENVLSIDSYYLDYNTFLDIQFGYQEGATWDPTDHWYIRFGSFSGMGVMSYENYEYESLDGQNFYRVKYETDPETGYIINRIKPTGDIIQNYNMLFTLNTANGYDSFDKTILSNIIKKAVIRDQTFYKFNGSEWIKQ